jgi:hypothetical protein
LYTTCLMISVLTELRTYDSSNLEMVRHLILSECQSAERIRGGMFSSGGTVLASSGSSNSDDEESEASGILAHHAACRTATPDCSYVSCSHSLALGESINQEWCRLRN